MDLFDDLLSAFRQDVLVKRYETWDDVLDYCRRSANPVGRLVLRLAGYRDAALDELVRRRLHGAAAHELLAGSRARLAQGRLYVPRDGRARGAARTNDDLDRRRMTPEWRTALASAARDDARAVR